MTADETVYAFLKARISDGFWRESAFNFIRNSLTTNDSFVGTIFSQHVFRHRGQPYIKCWRAKANIIYPHSNEQILTVIEYTFDPKRKMAHRVTRKAYKGKAA